jgi:hypothetical protein
MSPEVCTDCVRAQRRFQALLVLGYLNRPCARTQAYTVSVGVHGL